MLLATHIRLPLCFQSLCLRRDTSSSWPSYALIMCICASVLFPAFPFDLLIPPHPFDLSLVLFLRESILESGVDTFVL